MKVLLDTCVISELQKPNGNPSVKRVVSEYAEDNIFISVITIGEIAKGIALLDDGSRKLNLGSWLNGLEKSYVNNIIKMELRRITIHLEDIKEL